MGRTDAVAFNLQVAAEARRLDPRLVIDFLPGWETRGNGSSANYEGGIIHHTAFISTDANPFPARNTLINGRPDLSGPLCNWAGPRCAADRPTLAVVAAFPANHAGASGGRSMGPLPKTSLFNPRVLGLEIDYAGTSAMTPGQYRAALVWGRAVANVLNVSAEHIRAHFETSITGKWDPGYAPGVSLDMSVVRRDITNLTPSGGFLMALSDAQQAQLLQQIDNLHAVLFYGSAGTPHETTVYQRVARIEAAVKAGLLDPDAVATKVADRVVTTLQGQTGVTKADVRAAVVDVLLHGAA